MSKDVLISSRAHKEFKKLSPDMKKRIRSALNKLGVGDKSLDIKKLKGISGREDLYRLRVGDYRITYKSEKKVIKVIRIEFRGKDYSWLD